MKITYYEKTNSLYIDLKSKQPALSKKTINGIITDFDEKGEIVGIDVLKVSKKIDPEILKKYTHMQ